MAGCLSRPGGGFCVILTCLLAIGLTIGLVRADEPPPAAEAGKKAEWQPEAPMPEKFDWIQLKSDEWLKGEIIVMYDGDLEFDSDELDLLTIDWAKVKQVRSAQVMEIGFLHNISAIGKLWVEGDTVRVIGDEVREFRRSQILTITSDAPTEWSRWSGKVSLGLTVRQGNVDQVDANVRANFKRRTIENRIVIDYLSNFSDVEDVETINNQRANVKWDKFLTDRFFINPAIFEWYRDRFQNISSRTTFGVGAGYQLIDTARTEWQVSGGPGFQQTSFVSVIAGEDDSSSTGALTIDTIFEQDWTKAIEFVFQYRAQFTNEASGQYNHHMVMAFETEWTSILDFDFTMVWDRTEKPREDDQGITPEQDDFRMVVALGIEF